MKKIFIVDTPYHLLISLVKTILENRIGIDTIIVINNTIPSNVTKNLHLVFKDVICHLNRSLVLADIFLSKAQEKFHIPKKKTNILETIFERNSEIYIFNDNCYLGCWLNARKRNYTHIEDALDNFKQPKYKSKRIKFYDLIYKLLGISWNYWGTSKYIKSIEVNENLNLRQTHGIIIEQNRNQMFKALSAEQIDTIAKIFAYQQLKNVEQGDTTLLLTQPLAEDDVVSHTTKIELYKFLVSKYAIGKLYIKIHPREREDYLKFFPNAIILGSQNIPFEVYQLKENFHFKRAITAYSAAIDAVFCADEKISMSSEWVLNFNKEHTSL